jgi:uncharacterized RDD family membrane protein YckC
MTDPVDSLTQAVAERVIDRVVDALDVNALLDRVDLNRLLDRVDLNSVLDRIDVDRLLDRAGVMALVARVDVNSVVQRIDVNSVVQRVDVDALVAETGVGTVLARSSASVLTRALDVVRSQAAGLDELAARMVGRPRRAGNYAGAVSRFTAYAIDVLVGGGLYLLGLAAAAFAVSIVIGRQEMLGSGSPVAEGIFAAWLFGYFAYSWAAFGKTIGMALLGVRVVRTGGAALDGRRALLRTAAFPLSLLIFGLGFAGILVQRNRRALHDLIAGTVVVYSRHSPARAEPARAEAVSAPALPAGPP